MKLEGTLDVFPLRELIEITVYSSVTGVLTLFVNGDPGRIYFRDGRPYHASCSDATGERAVALLFEQRNGSFTFTADATSDSETLWQDPIELIEMSERMAARWAQVRMQIDGTWLVPQLISDAEAARIQISSDHWMVLSGIDNERQLDEIAEDLGLELLEVCEAVLQMQRDGLLTLHKRDPDAPRPQAEARAKAHQGLLDRVLANLPTDATKPSDQNGAAASQPAPPAAPRSAEIERILRLLRDS